MSARPHGTRRLQDVRKRLFDLCVASALLIVLSPAVSGKASSMFPTADFDLFPLSNPGIVSIPLSFILGYLGTVLSKEKDPAKYAEMEVRALTGVGAEKATAH